MVSAECSRVIAFVSSRLTEEINDFVAYAQPNAADQSRREQLIEKVRAAVREKWPDCAVEVFGSYKTGLYLPTGDIDMVLGCAKFARKMRIWSRPVCEKSERVLPFPG